MPLIVTLARLAIEALMVAIVISSVLSWFRTDPRNPFIRALQAVVDPVLHPLRALLPPTGGLDFSPMVAILVLLVLQRLLP